MPIQYYDATWFNNRPPQARVKIAPKLVVVFAPGSTDFFSRRGENTLSMEQLTEKYGETVFKQYDLDVGEADAKDDAKASSKGADETSDADDEGDGDSIGSEDSDEDAEVSDAASMGSFISDHGASDNEQDDAMYSEDGESGEDHEQSGAMSGEEAAGSGEDGSWDGMAQIAAAYDVDMDQQDLEAQIFGSDD